MSTFETVLAVVVGFVVTLLLGRVLIPFLHKLKYGQTILDIGPKWHKAKQGTPTMGGIMFIAGTILATGVAYTVYVVAGPRGFDAVEAAGAVRLFSGIVMAAAFGAMGFVDDYIKVVKKRNLGLTEKQKLVIQAVITAAYLAVLYLSGDTSTTVAIPFLGQWDMGLLYYPVMFLGIIFIVNAVNITDGIDGLCSCVTFVVALGYMIIANILGFTGMNLLAAALGGSLVAFLIYNFNPAKVFMGDTGSMFLGGLVVAFAFGMGIPAILVLSALLYIIEALSVVIQVTYFKLTHGKRLFKMSPIHHHFEMSGYSEVKICVTFSLVALAGVVLAVFAVLQMLR